MSTDEGEEMRGEEPLSSSVIKGLLDKAEHNRGNNEIKKTMMGQNKTGNLNTHRQSGKWGVRKWDKR